MGRVTLSPNLASILASNPLLKNAVVEAAETILTSALLQVPHGPTGNLEASGRVELDTEGEEGIVALVVFGDEEAYYAAFVEFGTSEMAPNAFVRRGAEAAGFEPTARRR